MTSNLQGNEIAVIGMSCRFPAAKSAMKFWENLCKGIEAITFFTNQQLIDAGVDSEIVKDKNYVKAKAILEDIDMFDANFFGFTPREAEITDPQQRIFLETAWEALEDAGYVSDKYDGLIGVYVGQGQSNYFINNLYPNRDLMQSVSTYQMLIGNKVDFFATRASYKLNLKGPSITVQTACSTSLVAIHMACQSLLMRECDIALSGGVKISVPQISGTWYEEGGVTSDDGHCRPFDSKSCGFVNGNGSGVVVLKRYDEALRDKDNIYAIIKGSAINNDGAEKIGFTAPSIDRQSEVICEAQAISNIDSKSVTYIEAHGTATQLGDPIEIAALSKAFNTKAKQYCAIGSVKSNIGHLDAAAGVAGFIKTVLALKFKAIPPTIHYENPNSKINFYDSPFFVTNKLSDWKVKGMPRRAGVSSFGMGGTNAHLILEEFQGRVDQQDYKLSQIILLSAKSHNALEQMTENLKEFMMRNPNVNFSNLAYTLQVGRKEFQFRRKFVSPDIKTSIEILTNKEKFSVSTNKVNNGNPSIVFLFPGQGSQYVTMAKELYYVEPLFAQEVDRCFEILDHIGRSNLKGMIFEQNLTSQKDDNEINQTENAQLSIFIIEYALAKFLITIGIRPKIMLGHSIGEYAAACISGVLGLEDSLKIILARGFLMQQTEKGSMAAVFINENKLSHFLKENVAIAAVNGPDNCVISGLKKPVEDILQELRDEGYESKILKTSHAFHSNLMNPILKKFEGEVNDINIKNGKIPYISNVTGKKINYSEIDSQYWSKHIRNTVKFHEGVEEVLSENKECIFLEVGPGRSLTSIVRQIIGTDDRLIALNLLRTSKETIPDYHLFLSRLGDLWALGMEVNFGKLHQTGSRERISLPTYPFERQSYWVEPNNQVKNEVLSRHDKISNIDNWFFTPIWEQSYLNNISTDTNSTNEVGLVFIDDKGIGLEILKKIKIFKKVLIVKKGESFQIDKECFILNPAVESEYKELFKALLEQNNVPTKIIHLWSLDIEGYHGLKNLNYSQDIGLYSVLNLVKALGIVETKLPVSLEVISDNLFSITGNEYLYPEKATLIGAIKIIPLEYSNINCRIIEIETTKNNRKHTIKNLVQELVLVQENQIVAYRNNRRWEQKFKALTLNKPSKAEEILKEGGTYLITGGLGGMGYTFAEYLSRNFKAKLILVGRSYLPPRIKWDNYLANGKNDSISIGINKIRCLESYGAKVLYFSSDIGDQIQMAKVIEEAKQKFRSIHGVLHTAGVADLSGVIHKRTRLMNEEVMKPKVRGTLILEKVLEEENLNFFVCFSSIGNQLYKLKFGQVGYNAANEFLDAFAHYNHKIGNTYIQTINWNDWLEVGMSIQAVNRKTEKDQNIDYRSILDNPITPEEGIEILKRVLNSKIPQLVVSTKDLNELIKNTLSPAESVVSTLETTTDRLDISLKPHPVLSSKFIDSSNEVEDILVDIFKSFFGFSQIGVLDDFYDLGGDSLQSITMISQIKKEFNVRMSLVNFLENSTVRKISQFIITNARTTI